MQLFTHIYQLKLIPPTGNVKEFGTQYGTAKRGINENGETIILRPGSSDGAPTIEKQVKGRKKVEIRYD